jgi:tripartite-type tricarboxylate transporter receptor subunit TctC
MTFPMTRGMTRTRTLLFAIVSVLASGAELGAAYPMRPVRLVVASAPGGGNDFVARAINPKLAELLGNAVVIDNRGGIGGLLAAEIIAKATADGYTLLQIPSNFVILPSMHKKLPFDVIRDFAPVVNVASTPMLLVVNPSFPATTVQQLIEFARSRKSPLNFASPGVGSIGHLSGELFKFMTKIDMNHVPYKGGGPSLVAVASNEVELLFSTLPTAYAQVKAGRLRAIGVTSAKRSGIAPQVPTIAEQGLPNFEVVTWIGMFAPAATPAAIVNLLNANVNKALASAQIRELFLTTGVEAEGGTPRQFADQVKRDDKNWMEMATQAHIDPQ